MRAAGVNKDFNSVRLLLFVPRTATPRLLNPPGIVRALVSVPSQLASKILGATSVPRKRCEVTPASRRPASRRVDDRLGPPSGEKEREREIERAGEQSGERGPSVPASFQ